MKGIFVVALVLMGSVVFGQDSSRVGTFRLTFAQAEYLYYVVDHSNLPHTEIEDEKTFLLALFKQAFTTPPKIEIKPKLDSTIKKPPVKK